MSLSPTPTATAPALNRIVEEAGPATQEAIRQLWALQQTRTLPVRWSDVASNRAVPWNSLAYADCTFTAQSGNWTVDSGDFSYYKYTRLGSMVWIKGAFLNTSVTATPTELRVTAPPGVVFTGNDSFGFSVTTQDGFATQDTGQTICRTSSGLIVFKPRTGGTWGTTVNLTGVIFSVFAEINA